MILKPRQRGQLMSLPVMLISTIGKDGVYNIAPWSCVAPILRPLDEILIASWLERDTLDNIRETKEFVVNIPSIDLAEEVMICAKGFSPDVDEFEKSGLKPKQSNKIKAPGIEECVGWMECTLVEEILREKYSLIIGKVVHLEADDKCFNKNGEIDIEKAKLMYMMMGDKGMNFATPVVTGHCARHN